MGVGGKNVSGGKNVLQHSLSGGLPLRGFENDALSRGTGGLRYLGIFGLGRWCPLAWDLGMYGVGSESGRKSGGYGVGSESARKSGGYGAGSKSTRKSGGYGVGSESARKLGGSDEGGGGVESFNNQLKSRVGESVG